MGSSRQTFELSPDGSRPQDPKATVGAAVTLAAAAALASYVPVLRATRVDPMALRHD